MSSPQPAPVPPEDRLESWKAIADYLRKGVTTVRRWEREEGLPVHRQEHIKRGSVVAFKPELDAWLQSRTTPLPEEPSSPGQPLQSALLVEQPPWRLRHPLATAGVAVAAGLVGLLGLGAYITQDRSPIVEHRLRHLTVDPGHENYITFAPGGRQFAYSRQPNEIWVKQVGTEPPRLFHRDPEKACCPKWSPDGRWIAVAVLKKGTLWNVQLFDARTGVRGPAAAGGPGMSWRPDSKAVIFALGSPSAMHEWSFETGGVRKLSDPAAGSWGDIDGSVSADGARLAVLRYPSKGDGDVWVGPYLKGSGPVPEFTRLTHTNNWITSLAWLDDDRLIAFPGTWREHGGLYLVASDGKSDPFPVPEASGRAIYPQSARLPDGSWRLGYGVETWNPDILMWDARRRETVRKIASTEGEEWPALSSDGSRLAFMSDRDGSNQLWVCDGACQAPRRITSLAEVSTTLMPHWSPDASRIAFSALWKGSHSILSVDPEGRDLRVCSTGFDERQPEWSADGRFLYFRSNRTGRMEIWKVAVSGATTATAPQQVTRAGGVEAQASADGAYLYLLRLEENAPLIRHTIATGEEREVSGIPYIKQGTFAVSGNRIIYNDRASARFKRFDPATGETADLCAAPEQSIGMTATRDGSAFAWSETGPLQSNLRAVDMRFRRPWPQLLSAR